MSDSIDPRTGRSIGDHGTAMQAVEFALDHLDVERDTFLKCWREGDLDEWPEFYEWLARSDASARTTPKLSDGQASERKHTPGPWEFFSNDMGVGVTAPTADVAYCGGFDTRRGREEEEANARLTAAAPDLLIALKALLEYAGIIEERCGDAETNDARAAIAKAEGRSTE